MTASAAFGLGVPEVGLRDGDRSAVIAEHVQTAERDGFDSLWVMETGLRSVSEGGDPASFAIAKRVYVHVDEDEKRAGRRTKQFFADFYGHAVSSAVAPLAS